MLFSHVALTSSFLPAAAQECSLLSRSSLGFIVCSHFDDGFCMSFELILCHFDLQFLGNEPWRGVFYLMVFFSPSHVRGLLNLPFEICFWKACPVSNCDSMAHLRPIFEGWSHF